MSGEYEISPLSGTDRAVQTIAAIGNSKLCKLSIRSSRACIVLTVMHK